MINRILAIVIVVWFIMFATDMICFTLLMSKPVFMTSFCGGEIVEYRGLGYSIDHFVPMTTIDDPVQSDYKIKTTPYLPINAVLIAILFIITIINRKKNNKHHE